MPSLEGLPAKAKEAPSPHEVRLATLDTNPAFQSLGGDFCFAFVWSFIYEALKLSYNEFEDIWASQALLFLSESEKNSTCKYWS